MTRDGRRLLTAAILVLLAGATFLSAPASGLRRADDAYTLDPRIEIPRPDLALTGPEKRALLESTGQTRADDPAFSAVDAFLDAIAPMDQVAVAHARVGCSRGVTLDDPCEPTYSAGVRVLEFRVAVSPPSEEPRGSTGESRPHVVARANAPLAKHAWTQFETILAPAETESVDSPRTASPAPSGKTRAFATTPAAPAPDSAVWVPILLAAAILPFVAALYHRWGRADALESAARDRVYHAVRAVPGAPLHQLAARLLLHRTTVRYHLRVLERSGLVASRDCDGEVRYFPPGCDEATLRATVPRTARGSIAALVLQRPGSTVIEIAREAGVSGQLAAYHVQRLVSECAVQTVRVGRNVRVYPAAKTVTPPAE